MRVLSGGFVHRGMMREGIQGDGWKRDQAACWGWDSDTRRERA
jgi:hypothetical protein